MGCRPPAGWVGGVEDLPYILRVTPLDHVRHHSAQHVQEALDVQVIGSLKDTDSDLHMYIE